MRSHDDYSIGWVCALSIEAVAAKPADRNPDDNNNYILGSLQGHNVVIAYPNFGLEASFKSLRFKLIDIHLGDVVVNKPVNPWPRIDRNDGYGERGRDQSVRAEGLDQPASFLLTAIGKAETAAIFDESCISKYMSDIIQKNSITFAYPGLEQDILFESAYDHITSEPADNGCDHCNPDRIRTRNPRERHDPKVHYGRILSGQQLICHGETRDKVAHTQGVLCFETAVANLEDAAPYLIVRGICDYADSHRSSVWHAYAAAAAAAYTKEVISFIPTAPKTKTLVANAYADAMPILNALLLTRPKVDRKSLIALKGHRADGTCEWLIQHPSYREWLEDINVPLLWISGGPGKGKTMLAIYITEMLQPVVDAADNVLLYYFCSNRDKNRNTALTILRGIIHQWIDLRPHLAQHIKGSFEGTEETKYTISSFVALWRVFLTLLQQTQSSQVVCVLDGLDECDKESLRQLLDALGNCLSGFQEMPKPPLKLILLSRPQPAILENKLGKFKQIRLDDSEIQISHDVERYIFAKVEELACKQNFTKDMVAQIRKALVAGANGTFLWVGFVANELQDRSWDEINEILRRVPRGLGGVYRRLLQQIDDKEALVPVLQWIVLAARPLTVDELVIATNTQARGVLTATENMKNQLSLCGLLVKLEGDVVNLVHESAKEFFQSDQVKIKGIDMFRMGPDTHRCLMRICLNHVEHVYRTPGRVDEMPRHDPFLFYASQYWPVHFHHAMDVIDAASEFQRPFFHFISSIRENWWNFYWEQEKNGGNITWARMLITRHRRLVSRKDNYGRTPLSWAVNRGHRDVVELLLNHGARVNARDRSKLTALHIAVTGQYADIVSSKSEHGDTALIRAIQANSSEITQILLEHGARVDKLPTTPGVIALRGHTDSMEERVKELLGLQEQIFLARYKQASKKLDILMKTLSLSIRFSLMYRLLELYLKFVAFGRWEQITDELRQWAQAYRNFFVQLVVARNPEQLAAATDLPTQVFRVASPGDLHALLVISVLVGSETKLEAIRRGWREGDAITARAFSHWTAVACSRDAEEFLHYGIREFLKDFDTCIQSGDRDEMVARTVLLFTCHFAMLENNEARPIEYFSSVIAKFYEGYIGCNHEIELFSDVNQACVKELIVMSKTQDSHRLLLFMTKKGQDRFLNILSASCLILCRNQVTPHQWLIGEAIPDAMCPACKALVECLIIGKQYGLVLPTAALRKNVKQLLQSVSGVEDKINQFVDL
ncbi:ankyrin repeat protein [Xylaria arbuscula]|nr:ankyrin repeat protein [Xylaria arbuscula]